MIRDMMSNPQPHIRRKRCFFLLLTLHATVNRELSDIVPLLNWGQGGVNSFFLHAISLLAALWQTLGVAKSQWTLAVPNKAGPDNLWVTDADSSNSTNFHVMLAAWVFYFFLAGTWGGSRDTNSHPLLLCFWLCWPFFWGGGGESVISVK